MKKEDVMMCLTIDELYVISEGLDLLKNEFGVNLKVGKTDIQSVIDRVDSEIENIESN